MPNDSKIKEIKMILSDLKNSVETNSDSAYLSGRRVTANVYEQILYSAVIKYLTKKELSTDEIQAVQGYVFNLVESDYETLYNEEYRPSLAEFNAQRNHNVVTKIKLKPEFKKIINCIYNENKDKKPLKDKNRSYIKFDF